MVKVVHYRVGCIGCNSCVELAPDQWVMDDNDGKSCLKGAVEKKGVFILEISPAELEENKKAAKDCPSNVIKICD